LVLEIYENNTLPNTAKFYLFFISTGKQTEVAGGIKRPENFSARTSKMLLTNVFERCKTEKYFSRKVIF
jgi:hypothetical protein